MKTLNQYISESYHDTAAEDFLDELSDVVVYSKRNPFPRYHYSRAGWNNIRFGEEKYPTIIWEHDSDNKAILVMVTDMETREIQILYVENADPKYLHYSVKDQIIWNVPTKDWTQTYISKCAKILKDNN